MVVFFTILSINVVLHIVPLYICLATTEMSFVVAIIIGAHLLQKRRVTLFDVMAH